MKIDLDDIDSWAKFGKRGPDKASGRAHFTESKLFMAKGARRGGSMKVNVPPGAPKFVYCTGYTQRRGIGADSRTVHRNRLRSQANYHALDGKLGHAFSFDRDGVVDRVWHRVEEWEDDKRYFRASLNPLNHDEIRDWERFVSEFMETMQHGSHRTFDLEGKGLHWHSDGLLTDEDREAGKHIDWVASLHHETGRTHAHVLFRGMIGNEDLYIMPQATKQLYIMGQGVTSMDHHVGMKFEQSLEAEREMEKQIKRELRLDEQAMNAPRVGLDWDIDP
jgi:hypothetical protein